MLFSQEGSSSRPLLKYTSSPIHHSQHYDAALNFGMTIKAAPLHCEISCLSLQCSIHLSEPLEACNGADLEVYLFATDNQQCSSCCIVLVSLDQSWSPFINRGVVHLVLALAPAPCFNALIVAVWGLALEQTVRTSQMQRLSFAFTLRFKYFEHHGVMK